MGTGERTLTSAPQPRTARQTLNQSGTEPLEEGAQFTWETEAEVCSDGQRVESATEVCLGHGGNINEAIILTQTPPLYPQRPCPSPQAKENGFSVMPATI